MNTHLLPIDFVDPNSFHLPPEKLISLPYPEDSWYDPQSDSLSHERLLRLTRGIHLINEWWKKQELIIAYPIADHAFYQIEATKELESSIRQLHFTLSPHQKVSDRHLVFGNGATQVINAALYAIALFHSIQNGTPVERHVPVIPFYATEQKPGYVEDNSLIQLFHRGLLTWVDIEDHNRFDTRHLLEFVTTPNNPDGRILKAETGALYTIHDRVNHWSLFLNEDDRAVESDTLETDWVSIFSLSKILSFSGSRVGYAFIKDPQIAHFMKYYIMMATHGLVSDSQYRCHIALRYLLDHPSSLQDYVFWIRTQLQNRWNILREAMPDSIQLLNRQGPNAWIKTPGIAETFLKKKYALEATYGEEYGATPDHARINLLAKTNEFNEFIWRLTHPF